MPLSVTYKNDAFPEGETVELYGVALENGKAKELSEEEEIRMVQLLGDKPADAFKDSDVVKVSGSSSLKNVNDLLPPEPEEPKKDEESKKEEGGEK